MGLNFRAFVYFGTVLVANWGCGSDATPPQPTGEIIGHVEVSADVSAGGCLVVLEGTPLGARCDETGQFDIKNVPVGRWDLRIVTDSEASSIPAKRIAAGANPGLISDLGPVRLAKAGSIGGRVLAGGTGADLAFAVIAIPSVGVVTAPNANGGFLLTDVSPGTHEVVLITEAGTVVRRDINVLPGKVTIGADLDVGQIEANMVTLSGFARRGYSSNASGLTVELVDALDGRVIKTATSDGDGSFNMTVTYGTYAVRARDGDSPGTAVIPSVVVRGTLDISLPSALVLHRTDDLDGDGLVNDVESDDDGDGVPDTADAFPLDPAESKDSDGDGLGDRADLRSLGGTGVDRQNPTPDTDGDGKLDFEDNCPAVANVAQLDGDDDTIGDACDNCPLVENPDQSDSVANGTGDACRFCRTNGDCGGGKICGQFGQCVDCLSSSQCGDRVCDSGACVSCTSSTQCTGGQKCNGLTGRCADCLADADCGTSSACIQGQCYQQCTDNSQCPGEYCGNGACVECIENAHCAPNEFCDFGTCRPQCTTTADCIGGRVCDVATNTCVVPCSQTCAFGQACDSSMVCRDVCGSDAQCASFERCNSGFCGPECIATPECTGIDPFTVCQGGQCVPSGLCAVDGDCPADQVCNGGSCQTRPPGCSSACDCRQGEICQTGACVVDAGMTPNKFLAAGATGSGASVTSPSGSFPTVLASAVSGDVIAVRADDTLDITARVSVSTGGWKLVGGFVPCASNRWVRDPTKRSTINNSNPNGVGVLRIVGNIVTPAADVVVRNLAFGVADVNSLLVKHLDALLAPRFTADNLVFNLTPNQVNYHTLVGVSCTQCTDVRYTDISTPGIYETRSSTAVYLAEIATGWGSMTRIRTGPIISTSSAAARVVSGTGDVTITDTTCDALAAVIGSQQLNCIMVDGLTNGKATINGFQVPYANSNNFGGIHAGVYLRGVASFEIPAPTAGKVALIDGSAITESATSNGVRHGLYIEDSNGTAAGITVKLPTLNPGTVELNGIYIKGPRGNVTVSDCNLTGGATYNGTAVVLDSITTGIPTIARINSVGVTATNRGRGLWVKSVSAQPLGSFVVTDSSFTVAGATGATAQGFEVSASVGRIERSKFITQPGYISVGGTSTAGSTLELYSSYLHGALGSLSSLGIENYDSILYAVGNTIDGSGAVSTGISRGLWCNNGATAVFTSNLVSGGRSTNHHMAYSSNGTGCFTSASSNFDNNYFWFTAAGGQSAGDGVVQIAANASSSNNIIDTVGSNGCYDPQATQPDYRILSGSVCVNAGVLGTRRDLSSITKDVDNVTRPIGSAADIGASEKE